MGYQAVVMAFVAVAICAAAAVSARLCEWLRVWVILQRMPSPPGRGVLGHLAYFSDHVVGHQHHKTVTQWARTYGPLYRIRLANVHVRHLHFFL